MGVSTNVRNHGEPAISQPRISLIYWGNWGGAHPYDAYWATMASTPAFYNRLREYGATSLGSFRGHFDLPNGATGVLTEDQLVAGILQAIGTFVPQANDILMVFFPNRNTQSKLDNDHGFGGHHSSFVIGRNGPTTPWGVLEFFSDSGEWQRRSTHEVFEMITDWNVTSSCPPNAKCNCYENSTYGGWYDDASSNEIGDYCEGDTAMIAGSIAQQFWSQDACRCVRAEDLNNADCLGNGYFCPTVFRPSPIGWWAASFPTVWGWGNPSAYSFTGDYNGDGRTEFAQFLPSSGSTSYLNIQTGNVTTVNFTPNTYDTPVPGDYDGDGKTDIALWNSQTGNWTVQNSSAGPGAPPSVINWGQAGDIPVQADYDGDGTTDRAVFRTTQWAWYVLPSNGNPAETAVWNIVQAGDKPVAGDFNGDGFADFAFWRPVNGTWFVSYQFAGWYSQQWGVNGDIPIGRDVDDGWITDLTVYRPTGQYAGYWFTILSSSWTTWTPQWGQTGDVPITQ